MVGPERHVNDLVTSHATAEGRRSLYRYAIRHLPRRLRRRSRGNDVTVTVAVNGNGPPPETGVPTPLLSSAGSARGP